MTDEFKRALRMVHVERGGLSGGTCPCEMCQRRPAKGKRSARRTARRIVKRDDNKPPRGA